ncbi:MAG: zinc ribbon domain-containing protein [Desulfobacteraceae bacterium]|nr:MAG: zinc ribbon domain-containing protein [Desulfobacteraceae bacterium]
MAIETKEQVLEKVLSQDKPQCPHCGAEMTIWEVPPFNFSDGLGWGTPYLFICFNDECSMYVQGWENMEENYSQCASYRCMNYPGTKQFECIPVFSRTGGTGQIIDDEILAEQEILKEKTKRGFSILTDAYLAKDHVTVVRMLLDGTEPQRVRLKAAEMIGDIGVLEAIEPIKSARFGSEITQKKVDDSVKKIHERFFTRECPFCAEIIKKRAKICKHCVQDVAGK